MNQKAATTTVRGAPSLNIRRSMPSHGPRLITERILELFLIVARNPSCHCFVMATDKLVEIFEMQRALNLKIGVDTAAMAQDEQTKWILNYSRAMSQELAELVDSVPWKWWAKYQTFDQQNVRVEIVDMLHFLVSLAQVAGMTADDIHAAYMAKHQVNVARQESGYTTKDESDNRSI